MTNGINGAYTYYDYGANYVKTYSSVNQVSQYPQDSDAYSIQIFDGLGRTVLAGGNNPGSAGLYRGVWTQYDRMGRLLRQSNPTEINANWFPVGDDGGTALQPVTWTNAVGVSVSGNNLTKTASDNWGNSGASSTQTITSGSGYLEVTASETTTARMFGLAHSDPDQGYGIDFALAPYSSGTLYKFESGTYSIVGVYAAGDVLRVEVNAGAVTYRKNGNVISTGGTTATYPLLADTALYTNGATLNNVSISGASGGGGWVFSVPPEYDWKGRPTKVYNQDGSYKTFEYAGCGCAGGEVVTLTDEVEHQQKIYSDVLGRQFKTEILNTNGTVYSTTTNTLNARDQITNIRQTDNASSAYQDTTMSYDGYGRLATKHVPEQDSGTATTYAYNEDDTVASITDARA